MTAAVFICAGTLAGAGEQKTAAAKTDDVKIEDPENELFQSAVSLFKPLARDMDSPRLPFKTERVALGRTLFFDQRISATGKVSCAQCHQPKHYGTDAAQSPDTGNALKSRNVQSVLNASVNVYNNWYGDQASVEDQAFSSLTSPLGLGHKSSDEAIEKIRAIAEYRGLFAKAFPTDKEPINVENWATAVGAYERSLLTPAPFDAYLEGKLDAISRDAKTGLRKFMSTGCVACHNGIGIGGSSYQKFGIWSDYWLTTNSSPVDKGRYIITKDENDLYTFRVANLRNVTMTAPYFHDGSVKSLPEAIHVMAKIQLRKTISDEDVKDIIVFLKTLTGPLPNNFSPP
ncbi:MAG: cytochrome c peroxidase [Gallionellaceae bacterium]|nr:cytochrome c peroxidase [Gallionellaceae bacterium]